MADSAVAITAGSGTNIDTRTVSGGDHRQVIVIGDPTTDTAVATVNANGQLTVEISDFTNPSTTITRPSNTTGYTALDVISATPTATATLTVARVTAGAFRITGFRLTTNKTSGMDAIGIRARFWASAPTYSTSDNDAYAIVTGAANYLAKADFLLEQFADGASALAPPAELAELLGKLASGTTINFDLQTLNAFTPASGQTFTLTAFVERK